MGRHPGVVHLTGRSTDAPDERDATLRRARALLLDRLQEAGVAAAEVGGDAERGYRVGVDDIGAARGPVSDVLAEMVPEPPVTLVTVESYGTLGEAPVVGDYLSAASGPPDPREVPFSVLSTGYKSDAWMEGHCGPDR